MTVDTIRWAAISLYNIDLLLLTALPLEFPDADDGEDDDIADGGQQGHVGLCFPGAWVEGIGEDALNDTVGGPFGDIGRDLPELAQGGKHSGHNEEEEDQAGRDVDGLRVADESDDRLAKAEVDRAADHGCQEGEGVAGGLHLDIIDLVADEEEDDGDDGDHEQLDGEAAGHDGPAGCGGDPEALEDPFFAVAGD